MLLYAHPDADMECDTIWDVCCPAAGNTTINAFLPGAGCVERGEGDAAALDAITAAAAKAGCRIGLCTN
jgi:hypothetical protein